MDRVRYFVPVSYTHLTLLQQFGSPLPATGFGVNVDAVIKGMLDNGQIEPPMRPEALVFAMPDCEVAAMRCV